MNRVGVEPNDRHYKLGVDAIDGQARSVKLHDFSRDHGVFNFVEHAADGECYRYNRLTDNRANILPNEGLQCH
jgi:hypothetical protein